MRQLKPEAVPASCEDCKPVDLDEGNFDAWRMAIEYPVLREGGVDVPAAMDIMQIEGINNQALMLKKLHAIAVGYADGRRQTKNRHRGR
jgi:hypothetical protein